MGNNERGDETVKKKSCEKGEMSRKIGMEKYERTGLGEREKKSLIVPVVCRSNKSC